ncbi:MAG: tyrosine-type recombinase/integrase [Phycisphaerales bacterium]|nr:tyrosine-type recombinase/integrase [Phycisphaerales bacterium]
MERAGFDQKDQPLFPTADKQRQLTSKRMTRNDVFRMLRRRAKAVGLDEVVCCHSFRATGITEFRRAGGSLEKAQWMAAHESARTTKLYDRTEEEVSLDEIERIPSI